MSPGAVLFRPDNRNVLLVLEVDGRYCVTLYLDNVDPAFVGTTFEHPTEYLEKHYTAEPLGRSAPFTVR